MLGLRVRRAVALATRWGFGTIRARTLAASSWVCSPPPFTGSAADEDLAHLAFLIVTAIALRYAKGPILAIAAIAFFVMGSS